MKMKLALGKVRPWLWPSLCVLLLLLLGSLLFLVRDYEINRIQVQLDQDVSAMLGDIRTNLMRGQQDLSLLGSFDHEGANAARLNLLFEKAPAVVHAEFRNPRLELEWERSNPQYPSLFVEKPRRDALPDIQQACSNAERYNMAAYAPSTFWPMGQGTGQELMEMCLALSEDGKKVGFIVVTYSLPAMLRTMVSEDARRMRNVALTEADGTRISTVGPSRWNQNSLQSTQLLDLPGAAYMLRAEQAYPKLGPVPNALTVAVIVLSLSLVTVLTLLVRDVRKRQRTEQELANNLAFRQAMEHSLVAGLRALDMNGRISYVNTAFCAMVGLSADQLLGKGDPMPYWPQENAETYRQDRALRLANGGPSREGFETEFIRPDGTRFPVRIIEAPLINQQGTQSGWMSTILDLSEQRRMEELTRTSQERLQAAARLAMVGEMASLISHELNQPLAAIASYAQGCLNLLNEPDVKSSDTISDMTYAIQRVAAEAERAGKVIRSVSDLVRRRERERLSVPVAELFDAVMPLIQLRAQKANIDLKWEMSDEDLAVWCDRTMVEQVLLNLVRNGMQAMSEGAPPAPAYSRVLCVSARPLDANSDLRDETRDWIVISVTDHGHGLSQEVQDKLFTPFFTTKTDGMGLGLSLCRTIVEQHGGQLLCAPNQPRGTVFSFTLPVTS